MRINTNISSIISYNALYRSSDKLARSVDRLSTGLKVSRAADDAAGLAISEKMRAQVRGVDQAYKNAQDGISLLQTAEGALSEIHSVLHRMRELSVQSANGSLTSKDRDYIQLEIDQLAAHINDISSQTQFNRKKLLDGSASVVWSTNSTDVGVLVTGSIRTKDIAGNVESRAGNYKITFNEVAAGTENIQKSNIFTLKHGTVSQSSVIYGYEDENVKLASASGLRSVDALNMVEGDWRIETRSAPYGGVTYYNGATQVPAADIGLMSLGATTGTELVAPGEYDVRVSDKVPMMADFGEALEAGAVTDIRQSNVPLTGTAARDFDVEFEKTSGVAHASTTDLYRNYSGLAVDARVGTTTTLGTNDIAIATNADAAANVFVKYTVEDSPAGARDVSAVTHITESYTVATDAAVDVTLAYQSSAAAEVKATYKYDTGAKQEIEFVSNWEMNNGTWISFGSVRTGSGAWSDINIVLDNGDTFDDVIDQLKTKLGAGASVTVDLVLGGDGAPDKRTIKIDAGAGRSVRIGYYSNGAAISGDDLAFLSMFGLGTRSNINGDRTYTGSASTLDVNKTYKIEIPASQNVQGVATALGAVLGSRGVSVNRTGATNQSRLEFIQNGVSNTSAHRITWKSGDLADELGLGVANNIGVTRNTRYYSTGLMPDGTGTTIDLSVPYVPYNFKNASLDVLVTRLKDALGSGAIPGVNAGDVAILKEKKSDVTPPADSNVSKVDNSALYRLKFTNDSRYTITLSGSLIDELNDNKPLTLGKGVDAMTSVGVFDGATYTLDLNPENSTAMTADQARTEMVSRLSSILALDGLTKNDKNDKNDNLAGDIITQKINDSDPATGSIQLGLANVDNSAYNITLGPSDTKSELFGTVSSVARGNAAAQWGTELAHNKKSLLFDANLSMQETFTAVEKWDGGKKLKVDWVKDPYDAASNGKGQYTITNRTNDASGTARRTYTIEHQPGGAGQASLMAADATIVAGGANTVGTSANTDVWTAIDGVVLKLEYEGNLADGTHISGTTRASVEESNDAAAAAANAASLNRALNNSIGRNVNLFNEFYVRDKTTGIDTPEGSTWITYTSAAVAGDATTLKTNVYDSVYGDSGEITYAFSNDARDKLDNKNITIGQMLAKVGDEDVTRLNHHITFGAKASDNETVDFRYGQRADAGDETAWRLGSSTPAWYAQTYYGRDTTYYFRRERVEPENVILGASVSAMNGVNASLMFTWDGSTLWAQGKGFDDEGNAVPELDGTGVALTPGQYSGGAADILGIDFTNFNIDTSHLSAGDKFVVNVSAAAKLTSGMVNRGLGDFQSTANVAVSGDPYQLGNEKTNSKAQYRLVSGAENGQTLELLGYAIDPINGSSNEPGVGYSAGRLVLRVDDTGFGAGSTVGDPKGTEAGSFRAHAEINEQGQTDFSASVRVTSAFFHIMEIEPGEHNIGEMLFPGLSYSNYEYGVRSDGKWGALDEAGKEVYSKMNGSMVFEVMDVVNDAITFRVQGHFIGRDGREHYAQDERVVLGGHDNTSAGPVHIFGDTEFGGVFFDKLELGDYENWYVGDRFTLNLTASGYNDGEPMDGGAGKGIGEIDVWSDNRGTAAPHSYRFDDGVVDDKTIDLHIYQLTNNSLKDKDNGSNYSSDQVMDGTLKLSFGKFHPVPEATSVRPAATFEVRYKEGIDAGVAHYYSSLRDVAQFYDANGRFILEGEHESISMKQGSRFTTMHLGSVSEIGALTRRLSEQLWNEILKQRQEGLKGEDDLFDADAEKDRMLSEEDKYKLVHFINYRPGNESTESVVGTMLAHSVIAGQRAALEFFGSEIIVNAFNFTTIQEGTDSEFSAYVTDAHSGKIVSSNVKIISGETNYDALFDGVALTIDSDLGILAAKYDQGAGTFVLDVNDQFTTVVHLADTGLTLQVGANEGEDMALALADMSAEALGVANLSVHSRESSARAITLIDAAINAVSKQRAVVGAQINRLEHTLTNLANTSKDLTEARSRIVDIDMAAEMANKTRLDIVTQASTSMLMQANQIGSNVLSLLR